MTNNDILRRLRYTFNYEDPAMINIFGLGGYEVTRPQVSNWLKNDRDEEMKEITDVELAVFLNGLIIEKRGKKDGPLPDPEKELNNNIILRKLKIALNLKDDDMIAVLKLADLRVSKPELSAFFRKPGHQHYRTCQDQILRNFLQGLQMKYRPKG
jgi:uncharacterized protein YehS (DUF1456 family)